MASSSNSEVKSSYDIFLSFRGETLKKFTGYLNEALKKEGFKTFVADDEIGRGETIKSELWNAIRNSKMSIIVLSKNYPKSTACLFETQKIMEHHKEKTDYFILPVFYEVDPVEIKEQAKNLDFGGKKVTAQKAKRKRAAFERIILPLLFMMDPGDINEQEHFDFGGKKVTVEEVEGWSVALKEVASMAGMFSGNHSNGYEFKFIDDIVGVVKSKRDGDYLDLDKDMKILKTEVEYLNGQKNDRISELSSGKRQSWVRPKEEVELWLKNVQQFKDDLESLEQKVARETNVYLRICLRKDIAKNIHEVSKLQERGRDFNGLLIDELPTGKLILPLTNDFVENTKARNIENIWKCLMNDDVKGIGVYGMGGVGKTTTMKHIHNQLLKRKGKFDFVYWVTVSKPFDILKLQSDIAAALNIHLRDDKDMTRRASQLNDAFSLQKRYVLILDDVWESFALETVGIPESIRCDGCKLVLTTRSLEVCKRMKCTPVRVDLLTEEEALTLFLRVAIGSDGALAPKVQEIAAKIAKECKRLPLAIVVAAGSLQGSTKIQEWRNAFNELNSSTKDASDDESEVFERLKCSYSRLGDKVLQDCFLYCSLYPEDHRIPVEELIEYWIAEGLIAEMESIQAKYDKGLAILGKLTSRCLVECGTDIFGMEGSVRLHDLIRDMALRITRSSPRFMVKTGKRLGSIPYEDWSEDLDKVSFMFGGTIELPFKPPVCPRLITLLLNHTLLLEICEGFFTNMPCLKVLDLSSGIMKSLPESISNLENLHAIILANCRQLGYMPSLEKLKALKEFTLTSSHMEELPEGIEKLVNLRKLDLSSNFRLWRFPSWKLRMLSKVQYLKLDETKVEVLAEDLLCLKQLKVVSVHFQNVQELTKYVISQQFQRLEMYFLRVGRFGHYWPIPGFKHAIDLRRCEIQCSEGLQSIFSTSTYSIGPPYNICFNLKELYIIECDDAKNIFAVQLLQNFPNLEKLVVQKCKNVEGIFVENGEVSDQGYHQDGSNIITRSKLKILDLRDLPRLKSIHNGVMVCRSIEEVIVLGCPMLRRLPFSLRVDNQQGTAPPTLKSIEAGLQWWESLEWDDPLTETFLWRYLRFYNIFLSYREGSRPPLNNFTDRLYGALKQEWYPTFRDGEMNLTGKDISPELRKAIQSSEMSIIVFSECSMRSKACLFEIKMIVEHDEANPDHVILPVYYRVDPFKIKKEAKNLEKNLAEWWAGDEVDIEGRKASVEKLKQCSAAVMMVARLDGVVSGERSEAEFIEEIVMNSKSKLAASRGLERMCKLKLNTDGSWGIITHKAGFGGLLRDDQGDWLAGYYGRMDAENSLQTEIWGLFQGLKVFVVKGFTNMEVETDSMEAKNLIQEGNATNHPQATIINEAHHLLEISGSTIAHKDRNANQCADHLAHFGAEQDEDLVVTFKPPISLREYMLRDKLGLYNITN